MIHADENFEQAAEVLAANRAVGRTVTLAESCTGGLVAAALTAVSGSSDVFGAGFVTYSNIAKTRMLGVDPAIFTAHGAVSRECAKAMAEGALAHSDADVAVAITGIAGPGGGSTDKPVGLVVFARATKGSRSAHFVQRIFFASRDRTAIRRAATAFALDLLHPDADALAEAEDGALPAP
jgi:nicotinamide-nucleotide amidase